MTFIPSYGRVTGRVYNVFLDADEKISYIVGKPTHTRVDSKHKTNFSLVTPDTNPDPTPPQYDPMRDSYSEYLERNGEYPRHFKVEYSRRE